MTKPVDNTQTISDFKIISKVTGKVIHTLRTKEEADTFVKAHKDTFWVHDEFVNNSQLTRQEIYRIKCNQVELLELGNMLFSERDPGLKRVAEEVLAERISVGFRQKPKS